MARSGSSQIYTWKIALNDSLEGREFHKPDNSLINITPFYEPYGYLELLNEKGGEELLAVESGWNNTLGAEKGGIHYSGMI